MVTVAAHHIGNVAFYPLLEEIECAVVRWLAYIPSLHPFTLWKFPFVRCFVHHQQPEAVADVIDHGCLRIVAHTDGVYAKLLDVFEASFPHLTRHGGSECAGIVVQAHSFYLGVAAIDGETIVGAEFKRAYAHLCGRTIDFLSIEQQLGMQGV